MPVAPIVEVSDESAYWEECIEYLGCVPGFFFNELACNCLASELCRDKVCPDGEDLIPTALCKCATYEKIKSIYPEGTTQESVRFSWELGLKKAQILASKKFTDGETFTGSGEYG